MLTGADGLLCAACHVKSCQAGAGLLKKGDILNNASVEAQHHVITPQFCSVPEVLPKNHTVQYSCSLNNYFSGFEEIHQICFSSDGMLLGFVEVYLQDKDLKGI